MATPEQAEEEISAEEAWEAFKQGQAAALVPFVLHAEGWEVLNERIDPDRLAMGWDMRAPDGTELFVEVPVPHQPTDQLR